MPRRYIMDDYRTIKVVSEAGGATLFLSRPQFLNAIDEEMGSELQTALKLLSHDEKVRCVAITGEGQAFPAGQDVKEIREGTSFGELVRKRYNPVIKLMIQMEKPVVAVVNGIAAGAGTTLALACDFRIMSSSAKLIQAFVRIGLVPDSGSSYFLPRMVGYARASDLAALGDEISSEEAMRLGLVNRVFAAEKLADESRKLLDRFSKGPAKAYALMKRSLNHCSTASLEESLDYEAYMREIAGRTANAREGIKAFVGKRAPSFDGK